MAVNRCTFSNNLKAKDLNYCDEFFSLKGEKITPSDSFSYNSYEALRNVNDFKTNNYSNLFLTKKQKTSDWLQFNDTLGDEIAGFITTIEWKNFNGQKSNWLYFDQKGNIKRNDYINCGAKIVNQKQKTNYSNYIFYIKFIDEIRCQIQHNFGGMNVFLCAESIGNIYFSNETDTDRNEFIYQIDGNKIKFYKTITGGFGGNEYTKNYCLGIKRDINNQAIITLLDASDEDNDDNVCYIQNEQFDFDVYINDSWVSYDRSNYISSIDNERSANNLETQALIHHQYNKDGGFNFIPLKNNLTYKGNSVRGNNINLSDENYPDVDYRTYTTINSGLNQEKGKENIILNFNFTDQEYEINGGDDYKIIIEKSREDQLPSLFPYSSININDTKFIKNGAFGSNVPFFSDKIKRLQNGGTYPNNATYLCTWLYKRDDQHSAIWLDRYYYPNYMSAKDAEHKGENLIDKYITPSDIISDCVYFDKISDMVIEEDNTYRYQRISKQMVDEVLNNLESNRVSTALSRTNKKQDLLDDITINGDEYWKIKYDQWGRTNVINFNADFFLMRKKNMGIQIFGADYTHGFNIQNRKDLVPFYYVPTEKIIYILNNKNEIVHRFDFGSKFKGIKIKKVLLGDLFDDIIVIPEPENPESENTESGNKIYILGYDLQLKNEIEIEDSDSLKKLRENNATIYNNNIYIPDGYKIIKYVLSPDCDEDEFLKFRTLKVNEYKLNFQKKNDSNVVINNIYISENGSIYGLDYVQYSLTMDKDVIYGLSDDDDDDNDDCKTIYQQHLTKITEDVDISRYEEFKSQTNQIKKICFNANGEMCIVIRNESEEKDITKKPNYTVKIFDKTKKLINSFDLDYDEIHSLDGYNFIDENMTEKTCFALLCSLNKDILYKVTYVSNDEKVIVTTLSGIDLKPEGEDKNSLLDNFESINNNRIMNYNNENVLYFNLHVSPSDGKSIYDKKLTIKVPLDNIQDGWHNVHAYINLDDAVFQVKINDVIYETINEGTHDWFKPYVSSNGTLFNKTYYIGGLGKKYGSSLNDELKNGDIDPYICKNLKIRNLQIYTKKLSYYERQAIRMRGKRINKLILTLPCGNRNSIDEIVRYFKYSASTAISNKVKINLTGTGIKTNAEMNEVRKEIISALENNKDCLIKIKDIEFIEE